MALGTITRNADRSEQTDEPIFFETISFEGDDAYTTGGTTGFQALVRTAVGRAVTILAVIPLDCGGFIPAYDPANDTLKVYEAAADGNPLDEAAAAADLSGTTFNVTVVAQ